MYLFFFFNDTATTEIYTLSLHDALPISDGPAAARSGARLMISAREALARLQEGNRGFVAGLRDAGSTLGQTRRPALPLSQEPFAIVLGCSDSRVPAELVFGQGFGDLFVIRVAGNIVAPSQVGSVEFAAAQIGRAHV